MTRSAVIAWGGKPPRDLHSIVDGRVGTWAEVMEHRRAEQRRRLQYIARVDRWRPYRVSVPYFDQRLMGGWHAFVDAAAGPDRHAWVDRDRRHLMPQLMDLFPLVLNVPDRWSLWKQAFAREFRRGTQCRQPRGAAAVWWNGRDPMRLTLPEGAVI